MKKMLVIMAMGLFLFSCRPSEVNRIVAGTASGIVGAPACAIAPAMSPASEPVREKREPVILLRILTEL